MAGDLERALRDDDVDAVVAWVSTSTAADRKQARERVFEEVAVQLLGARPGRYAARSLAILATGRWADVKRAWVRVDPSLEEQLVTVVRHVRPEWLSKWVADQLSRDAWGLDWRLVRRLLREGLAEVPSEPAGLLRCLLRFLRTHPPAVVVETFRADPGGLDAFWQLFELDFGGFREVFAGDTSLLGSVSALVTDGLVDRGRVVAASAGAVAVMGKQDAPGYVRLHEALAPSLPERAALQPTYVDLLRHPEGPVVGFALAALAELERGGALDDRAFAEGVGPVFSLRPMNHPKAALALLDRVAGRDPALALEPLLQALDHPAPQVQSLAVDLLERHGGGAARELLRERLPSVVDSLRPRLRALVGRDEPATTTVLPTGSTEGLPDALVALAGLDEILRGALAPVAFGPTDVPRVDPDRRVHPIRDVDELCDELSLAISQSGALRFERVLDGVARLGAGIGAARLAPLVAREPEFATVLVHEVLRLVKAAMGQPVAPHPLLGWPGRARVDEVVHRLRVGRPGPRLALPSDERGFLHPEDWVRRLRAPGPHDTADRITALRRLAPEDRAAALPHLTDDAWAPERYAAGGPAPARVDDVDLWLAAARARDPFGDVSAVVRVEGAHGSGRVLWRLEEVPRFRGSDERRLRVVAAQAPPAGGLALVRAAAPPSHLAHEWVNADDIGSAFLAWPACPHATLAVGVHVLDDRKDSTSNAMSPVAPFAAPLFDPNLRWMDGDPALPGLVAALGLTSADPQLKGLVVDAAIGAITDGRLADGAWAASFALLATHGRLKWSRVAAGLQEIARAGALHRHVVTDVAMTWLATTAEAPPDLHHLLEALREWLAGAERPLDPRCEPVLRPLVGKTKTGKLAGALLARVGPSTPPAEVLAEAAAGRRARVERWLRSRSVG
jgi:hypothetical protein